MLKTRTRPRKVDWILLCVSITLFVSNVGGDDPVFSPSTLNDAAGNFADEDSVITWADLPASESYNAGNPSRVSEGLTPYYNFMHSFVGSVFPVDLSDTVSDLIGHFNNGTLDQIVSNYSKYINVFLGYAVCVAVGVLFILIFPIVACCVCCCRCCGNCGGKMTQKDEEAENTCARNTFAILLAVMVAFITVGMVCAFLNNNNTTTAIDGIADTARSNLNDIKTFVNNTVDEANHIARNNYEFLKSALLRDIDNIGYLVGIPLRTTIKDNTGIESVISEAYTLNDDLTQASTDLDDVNTKFDNLNKSLSELETALNNVQTNLDTAFASCGCTGGPDYNTATTVGIDSSQFPDLSSQTADMSSATGQNLTEKVAEAEQELTDIPWRVHNDSEQTRTDIRTSIDNLSDDIDPMLNKIDDIQNMIYGENATVNLTSYEETIDEYAKLASQYNKYRWYGGIGLTSIILLIVLLALLGLIFGMVSCSAGVNPPDRGCLSNCGGILLIVSAVLIFIFGALFMLLTTMTFLLGAPMEKFVCQTITDPSLTEMEKWIDGTYNNMEVGDGKYFLGKTFFSNDTIPLTVTGMLRDCKDNKAAFEAFKLGSQFDITDLLNYSKTLDVDAEIEKTNVNLSDVSVFPTSLQTQLTNLKSAININFTKFYDELNNSPSGNLTGLADELDNYANGTGNASFIAAITVETTELRRIQDEEVAYVNGNITALNTSVNAMETTVSGLPARIDAIETGLNETDTYIQNNASADIKDLLRTYASRLTGIADSFVAYTNRSVRTGLGKCVPVWNVYESFLVYTFCYNLMDTFNGFWFSLGWCVFFFIPSLIFSFKYSKFLRRMDYVPEDENAIPPKPDRSLPTPEIMDNNHKPMFKLSSSGITPNGGQTNSASVASIEKPPTEREVTDEPNVEHTRIYPDLSNRYAEPLDFVTQDYFTSSDNTALLADSNSPNHSAQVVLGKTIHTENEPDKSQHLKSDDYMHSEQLASEKEYHNSDKSKQMLESNCLETTDSSTVNITKTENVSPKQEEAQNETDTVNKEILCDVDEYNQTSQIDDDYSTDQFEDLRDEMDNSTSSSNKTINTVVNVRTRENDSTSERRFTESNLDETQDCMTDTYDKHNNIKTVSIDNQCFSESSSQQINNTHQINVSPVQNAEEANKYQVKQNTEDSDLADLAIV